MTLTSTDRARIVDLVVPRSPRWHPGMWTPPAGVRVIDKRGVLTKVTRGSRQGINLGEPSVALIGGRYESWYPRTATWAETKSGDNESDLIRWGDRTGTVYLIGIDCENGHDALGPNKSPSGNPNVDLVVEHSRFAWIRDDVHENDGKKLRTTLKHILADNVWCFVSDRPGAGNTVPRFASYDISNALVFCGCQPDDRARNDTCPPGHSKYRFWKSGGQPSRAVVRNSLFWSIGPSGSGSDDWFVGEGCVYENVWLIHRGTYRGQLPPGVQVIDDTDVWNMARDRWLEQHNLTGRDIGDGPVTPPTDPPAPPPVNPPAPVGWSPVLLTTNNPTSVRLISVSKPVNSVHAHITITAYDPDARDEAKVWINKNGPLQLYGEQVVGKDHNSKIISLTYTVPASWFPNSGPTELRFEHVRTGGSRIDKFEVIFEGEIPPGNDDDDDEPDDEPDEPDQIAELQALIKQLEGKLETAEELAGTLKSELADKDDRVKDLERRMAGIRDLVEAG